VQTEDGYIVSKCVDGESEAFGLLVDKYKEGIYAFVYAKLRDSGFRNFQDAQDVTQEAFIKAYEKLRSLRRWESFLSWLYCIANTQCKAFIRKQAGRPDREFIEDQDSRTLKKLYTDPGREYPMLELLHEALDSLPETYRQILTLHYLGGMSGTEIARFLRISPTAVWQRLSRARSKLKGELLAMMDTTFEGQKLQAGFTLHIVEMVRRIGIHPMPRTPGLPWGLGLAAGVIFAVVWLSPHLGIPKPSDILMDLTLPSETEVTEIGEIPVDVLKISRMLAISSSQGNDNVPTANATGRQSQKVEEMVEPIKTDEIEKRSVAIRVVDDQQRSIHGAVIRPDRLEPVNSGFDARVYRDPNNVYYSVFPLEGEFTTDRNGTAQIEYPGYVDCNFDDRRFEIKWITLYISHPDYVDLNINKPHTNMEPIVMSRWVELVAVALLGGVPVKQEFEVYPKPYLHPDKRDIEVKNQINEVTGGMLIQRMEEGTYPIYFSYTDQAGQQYYSAVERVELKPGSNQLELPLYPALSLKGILDPSIPRPIRNSKAQVNMINKKRGRIMKRWEETASVHRTFMADVSADGSFLFSQLPRGYGEIIVLCDGFFSRTNRSLPPDLPFSFNSRNQHFDLQSDGQEIIVDMEPTATFSGRVVNNEGQPVEGARIFLNLMERWGHGSKDDIFMAHDYHSAPTDVGGEFSVVNLPAGNPPLYGVSHPLYTLTIKKFEDIDPPLYQRFVKLRPGKETYEIIQVVLREEQAY